MMQSIDLNSFPIAPSATIRGFVTHTKQKLLFDLKQKYGFLSYSSIYTYATIPSFLREFCQSTAEVYENVLKPYKESVRLSQKGELVWIVKIFGKQKKIRFQLQKKQEVITDREIRLLVEIAKLKQQNNHLRKSMNKQKLIRKFCLPLSKSTANLTLYTITDSTLISCNGLPSSTAPNLFSFAPDNRLPSTGKFFIDIKINAIYGKGEASGLQVGVISKEQNSMSNKVIASFYGGMVYQMNVYGRVVKNVLACDGKAIQMVRIVLDLDSKQAEWEINGHSYLIRKLPTTTELYPFISLTEFGSSIETSVFQPYDSQIIKQETEQSSSTLPSNEEWKSGNNLHEKLFQVLVLHEDPFQEKDDQKESKAKIK